VLRVVATLPNQQPTLEKADIMSAFFCAQTFGYKKYCTSGNILPIFLWASAWKLTLCERKIQWEAF
jgi:hypothetical protein